MPTAKASRPATTCRRGALGVALWDRGSCLLFERLEDLPSEAVGKVITSTPPGRFIATVEAGCPKQ